MRSASSGLREPWGGEPILLRAYGGGAEASSRRVNGVPKSECRGRQRWSERADGVLPAEVAGAVQSGQDGGRRAEAQGTRSKELVAVELTDGSGGG
jgi:hypothetical protein